MKKKNALLLTIILLISINANAQSYWLGSSTLTTTIGNCNIEKDLHVGGGLIDMNIPTDNRWRTLYANSTTQGLTLLSKSTTSNGSSISLYAYNSTFPDPTRKGRIEYASYGTTGDGHVFYNYDPVANFFNTNLIIGNNGQTMIGHNLYSSLAEPGDVLTVENQLGFYKSTSSSNDWRGISGNSSIGGFEINSKSSTTDGSSISLYGANSTFPDPTRKGEIQYASYGTTGDGHVFYNYDGSTFHPNLIIGNNGQTVIGHNLYSSMAATGDVLTVENQLGFYKASGSNDWRGISGNSSVGGLAIFSQSTTTNGSSISMYADNSIFPDATRAGGIQYTSYGTSSSSGYGHVFYNYDITDHLFHTNLVIGNDGRTVIGHDMYCSMAATGDVLTVENQLGFYKSTSSSNDWRGISGNSSVGGLAIFSQSTTTNGSAISLYGAGSTFPDPARAGRIEYVSNGSTTLYGHIFYNYSATSFSPLMAITNTGQVVIGQDLINNPTTALPAGYQLYVETGILTEKLKVANHSDAFWSDFVFNKEYDLMPLNRVESYIKVNKHLPEIPSASDVAKDGIDVANMDAKLLQKIEELTLYVIQQQKEIDELKKQIKN